MRHSSCALVLAMVGCLSASASAQQRPDISGLWTRGGAANTLFRPPPSGTGPVMTLQIPGQTVPRQAGDYNSPLLQPWAKEVVRRQADRVLAQSTALHTPQETCWPMGVPHILQLNFHTQIIDDGKQITFLYERHNQRRIARLNASHPATLKPSWFGEFGGALGGRHAGRRHRRARPENVGRRFRHAAYGQIARRGTLPPARCQELLDVTIDVDDPGTFTTKWSAMVTYEKDGEPWLETICSENNIDAATGKLYDMPIASKPDF